MSSWLNYHHLLYFHAAVREGGVSAAARKLRLAQPTLSGQIRQLEEALGEPLFERRGRRLELTPTGRVVYRYAEEIVGLGQELVQAVRGRGPGRPRLAVGVADTLPKLLVYRLLQPALAADARLEVRDGDVPRLVAALGAHELDLVLADSPLPPGGGVRAWSHALGECGVHFFAPPALAHLAEAFPRSLDRAPMLMPAPDSALRRALDEWLDRLGVYPDIVGEIADSALLKAFGQAGAGLFVAPSAVEAEVRAQYDVVAIGATDEVRERFWALSGERRIRHPAVGAVVSGARAWFG